MLSSLTTSFKDKASQIFSETSSTPFKILWHSKSPHYYFITVAIISYIFPHNFLSERFLETDCLNIAAFYAFLSHKNECCITAVWLLISNSLLFSTQELNGFDRLVTMVSIKAN